MITKSWTNNITGIAKCDEYWWLPQKVESLLPFLFILFCINTVLNKKKMHQ
jgi:hypothetical protein